jgi:hypothetical protein
MFVQLSRQSKRLWARHKLSTVYRDARSDLLDRASGWASTLRCISSRSATTGEEASVNARYRADVLVGTVPPDA